MTGAPARSMEMGAPAGSIVAPADLHAQRPGRGRGRGVGRGRGRGQGLPMDALPDEAVAGAGRGRGRGGKRKCGKDDTLLDEGARLPPVRKRLGSVPDDAVSGLSMGCGKCRYKALGCRVCRQKLGLVECEDGSWIWNPSS